MHIKIAAHTNIGNTRRGNEDNFLVMNLAGNEFATGKGEPDFSSFLEIEQNESGAVLLAVADGFGGHIAGKEASRMVMDIVSAKIRQSGDDRKGDYSDGTLLINDLFSAIVSADEEILKKAAEDAYFLGMGANFTGAIINHDRARVLHLGENRLYLIRQDKIYQITRDQSFLQTLIDQGAVSEEDVRTSCISMQLWFFLGDDDKWSQYSQASSFQLFDGDILLLCTDGLFNHSLYPAGSRLNGEDLLKIIETNGKDLSGACREMIDSVNSKDGADNMTVILARVNGKDLPDADGAEPVIESILLPAFDDLPASSI